MSTSSVELAERLFSFKVSYTSSGIFFHQSFCTVESVQRYFTRSLYSRYLNHLAFLNMPSVQSLMGRYLSREIHSRGVSYAVRNNVFDVLSVKPLCHTRSPVLRILRGYNHLKDGPLMYLGPQGENFAGSTYYPPFPFKFLFFL